MLVWRWADVSMSPSMSQLPGGDTLQGLVNGLGAWALVAALVGLVVGAAAWALGVHSQNFQQSLVGRRAVLVSGLAALLIGAGPAITLCGSHISRCAAWLKIRRPSISPPPSCSSNQRDMSLTLEIMPPAGAIESQLTQPMLATGLSKDACGVA